MAKNEELHPRANSVYHLSTTVVLGRCTGLSLFHAEDIGLHYAETLKQWRERFTLRLEEVKALGFDERFLRMWEYYLSYCDGAFRERHIGDVQLVLTKQRAAVPLVIGTSEIRQVGVIS